MRRLIERMRAARHLTAALLLLTSVAACGGTVDESETGETVILGPADVATAQVVSISTGVALTGTLQPYREVEVKAQVPGVVTNLSADRGDAVSEGENLARIVAEGITSQASGARSGVAAAEANLALAQRQLESSRTLYDAGALSEIDFRTAQTQLEAAQAQLAAAQAQAAGAVEQAGRTTVVSPIDGEISERSVNQGEAVSPGQTLFRVVNSAFLELEGQVPVDQAVTVQRGQPVEFSISAYPGRLFEGTVARIAPVADPGTRRVAVVMRLPNEDRSLLGGLFASGRVITEAREDVVAVPERAVRGGEESNYVLVIENEQVVRRPVTIGAEDSTRGLIAISSGLEAGEQVVIAPGEIAEGAHVQTAAAARIDSVAEEME